MKKPFSLSVLLALFLTLCLPVASAFGHEAPASAHDAPATVLVANSGSNYNPKGLVDPETTTGAPTYSDGTAAPYRDAYVIDNYGLFDSSTYSQLESRAQSLSQAHGVGVYLLVVPNIGSSVVRTFAIDYYRFYELGLGPSKSGVLFLIAVDSRDYVTITYGKGVTVFTDYQIDAMEKAITEQLSENNWVPAAKAYLDQAETALQFYADKGEPLDSHNDPATAWIDALIKTAFALVIPALVARGVCRSGYRKMKTAHRQTQADDYLRNNSFTLLEQHDDFIGTHVTSTPRPKSTSSEGGGSSTGGGGFGGSSGGKF